MRTKIAENSLRRFSTLSAAIDLLKRERIAFLEPSTWDDRNDAYFLDLYKEAQGLPSVHALCCSQSAETFHHWKVFTQSADGCFIDFYKDRFLQAIHDDASYVFGPMRYRLMQQMRDEKSGLGIEDLPFIKRRSYEDEREFRVIHVGGTEKGTVHYMPVNLACVRRIVITPLMPKGVRSSVKSVLQELCGKHDIQITASAITSSVKWQGYGKAIARQATS